MYPWPHKRRFNAYPQYFKRSFGERVQKVSIDAGFSCPNRDGTVAYGGCTFCDNRTFNPSYCDPNKSVREQIETGIESCFETSLKRMNRGHSYQQAVDAIHQAADHGLRVGTHVILGLPCETQDMQVESARMLSKLPIDTVKFHQLQLIRGTAMLRDYERRPKDFTFDSFEAYCRRLTQIIEHLDPRIALLG